MSEFVGSGADHPPQARTPRWWTRKSLVVWLTLLPFGLLVAPVLLGVLPVHYTFDASTIRDFIVSGDRPAGFVVGEPYANTAYVYILFGVESSAVAGALFTYAAAWASVFAALWCANGGGRLWLWFPAFAWHAILLIYTCMHTKEVHAMPALALLLVLCGTRLSWPRIAAIALAVAAYAAYFRIYWAITGLLVLAFIVLRRRVREPLRLALAMALAYVLLFVVYNLATGTYLTDYRVTLTAGRELDLFSDSAFPNLVANDGLWSDLLNAVASFARLMVPLPLLVTGKPQHLAFAIWEMLNVGVFAVLFARVWRRPEIDARTEFSAAWILAFSLTQGIFEPDHGTFFRHQTTLLPAFALFCVNALWPAWSARRGGRSGGRVQAQALVDDARQVEAV